MDPLPLPRVRKATKTSTAAILSGLEGVAGKKAVNSDALNRQELGERGFAYRNAPLVAAGQVPRAHVEVAPPA